MGQRDEQMSEAGARERLAGPSGTRGPGVGCFQGPVLPNGLNLCAGGLDLRAFRIGHRSSQGEDAFLSPARLRYLFVE